MPSTNFRNINRLRSIYLILPIAFFFASLISCASTASPAKSSENSDRGEFRGAASTEYPSWFKIGFMDLKEDIADAKKSNKRLMIIFVQKGCPYCDALIRRNINPLRMQNYIRKRFDVITIDLWGDREVTNVDGTVYAEKKFAARLDVQFTPTVFIYDESGKIIVRLNGYLPPDKFLRALKYAADRVDRRMSYGEYVRSISKTKKKGRLIQEGFFMKPPYDLSSTSKSGGRPFAIFFEKSDCAACKVLHGKILADKLTRSIVTKFNCVQSRLDSQKTIILPDGKKMSMFELARKYNVRYAPTILLFEKNGREVIRSEAFFKTFHTQGMFAYVLTGSHKKQASFQRYLSDRADRFIKGGHNVDIWNYKSSHAD